MFLRGTNGLNNLSSGQGTMKDSEGNDEAGRKQKRTTTGSQTDEDSSKHLVEMLEEINHKLEKENDH